MTKVEKDFTTIPPNLKSKNREDAFNLNIIAKSFDNGTTLYKPEDVKQELFKIYNSKCAYCEKDIDDEPKHVEHYRPKDTYYWLAYSWDNLLLCCGKCNSSKGKKFKTENTKVNYNNEAFNNIHNLGSGYDDLEKPMIVNPENEDILNDIIFNKDAIIDSMNSRVKYTIDKACKLNKPSLVRKRIKIVNKLIRNISKHYLLFKKAGYKGLDRFEPDIEVFIEDCKQENEFYSLRYFMLNNIGIFFEDIPMRRIVENKMLELRTDET